MPDSCMDLKNPRSQLVLPIMHRVSKECSKLPGKIRWYTRCTNVAVIAGIIFCFFSIVFYKPNDDLKLMIY